MIHTWQDLGILQVEIAYLQWLAFPISVPSYWMAADLGDR